MLLFSEKAQTTSLYKMLSTYFKERLTFGQIHSSEEALVQKFGIDHFPTLIIVHGEKEPVKYDGVIAPDVLKQFLETVALPKDADEGKAPIVNNCSCADLHLC